MNITLDRTTTLWVCVLLLGFSLLLLSACGSGSQENEKNASGGTASTNGQIGFRRYLLIPA